MRYISPISFFFWSRKNFSAIFKQCTLPNGKKIAWFSDASGEYQLMIGDQEGLEKPKVISFEKPTFFFKPAWSPDGKYISFTDTDYNLWFADVATGISKKVDKERYAHPNRSLNPVWSPDSKWISYSRLLDNHFKVIKVYKISELYLNT